MLGVIQLLATLTNGFLYYARDLCVDADSILIMTRGTVGDLGDVWWHATGEGMSIDEKSDLSGTGGRGFLAICRLRTFRDIDKPCCIVGDSTQCSSKGVSCKCSPSSLNGFPS